MHRYIETVDDVVISTSLLPGYILPFIATICILLVSCFLLQSYSAIRCYRELCARVVKLSHACTVDLLNRHITSLTPVVETIFVVAIASRKLFSVLIMSHYLQYTQKNALLRLRMFYTTCGKLKKKKEKSVKTRGCLGLPMISPREKLPRVLVILGKLTQWLLFIITPYRQFYPQSTCHLNISFFFLTLPPYANPSGEFYKLTLCPRALHQEKLSWPKVCTISWSYNSEYVTILQYVYSTLISYLTSSM